MKYDNGMLLIEASGEATIGISKDGLPAMESVVPCPWGSPDQIEQAVKEATVSIHMQGYFITGTKLIRNMAFDKRGEKTTTQISFRACKNEQEAQYVLSKVKSIVEKHLKDGDKDEPEAEKTEVERRNPEHGVRGMWGVCF